MAVVDARDALGVGVKVHGWRPDGGPRRALYWMRMFIGVWPVGLMKVNDPRHVRGDVANATCAYHKTR